MSEEPAANGDVRQVLREVLAELLPEMVDGAVQRHALPADDAPVPQVPAPPVAAVHRPSTWTGDTELAAPDGPARRADGRATVEEVSIETDADLDAFARRLLQLYENPRDRQALRSGRLRFALRRRRGNPTAAAPVFRVENRAVTERVVDEAAAAGRRLVLGPGAVLTPLARDRAKALRVEIEKEK